MTIPPDLTGGEGLIGAAAIRAMMEARWEASDLLSRKSVAVAADLLRARAAELALSPGGRDQVMSVALEVAADDVAAGLSPLASGALFFFDRNDDAELRRALQREVLALSGAVDPQADALVARLEAEHRTAHDGPGAQADVAADLLDDARLHKRLWDDPRIPAPSDVRRTMLCSVPRLVDRARGLDPMRLRTLRALVRWPRRRTEPTT